MRCSRFSRTVGVAAALTIGAVVFHGGHGGQAFAQTDPNRAQARDLGEKGNAALERKDYPAAETAFAQADALYHVPTLVLGLARAQAQQGKYVEAWESYHRIVLDGAPPGANATILRAIEDAKTEIEGVASKRSKVTLTVTGADGPKVTLDGVAVPSAGLGLERPINPGRHAVHAEAPGMKAADGTFSVDPGKATTFTLAFEKDVPAPIAVVPPTMIPPPNDTAASPGADAPPKSGSLNRTLGFVGLGIGGAGIITGVITGIIASGKHGDLSNSPCASKACSPSDASTFNSDLDSYHSVGTISTIAFIVGGVAAAAGVILLVTAPKKQTTAWISPTIGLGSFGAAGQF